MKPLGATAISIEASDEQLVEWAQTGSSDAFAVLFRRYRPAVARYAGRILGDDARAEDIVQEVFLSALRSIETLDRPAGFKPWLYRIAHNTCVDHVRRTRRAAEVSIDANPLPASEEVRLFRRAPSTHAAVTQKEDFKNLREAFGGLPPSQSEVLVMRELEGLSYDEIAARMGVTHASVESMLFRARQGLRAEYGQIATGERCLRMRPVMARMAEGMGGLRDRRALARHVRGCDNCRRDAFAMGLAGAALESPATGLRGGLSRVAALLPLPWLIHRRPEETSAASSAGGGGSSLATQAQSAITQLSSSVGIGADQAATAIHKAVAVVAAVAVVGGGGYVASKGATRGDLLLKPDTLPTRADVGPAVPPALLPLKSSHSAATDPAAVAAVPGKPTAPAATATAPLLPTAPSGKPGPIKTLGMPDAVAAPTVPSEPAAGGDSPAGTGAPDTTSGTDTSVPAAGDTGSSNPDTGSTGGGTQGNGTQGGGSSGGEGTGTGGGSGSTGPPSDGGSPPTAGDPPPAACDLPPGLEKKDKIPPGWAKKCAFESAEQTLDREAWRVRYRGSRVRLPASRRGRER
ncbi:MAG: RNA polymerase sigma factor [Solirubrobacterales bacterium]